MKNNNKVIKVLNKEHAKEAHAAWKIVLDNKVRYDEFTTYESLGDTCIYYGLIAGRFQNYSLQEVEAANIQIVTVSELLNPEPVFPIYAKWNRSAPGVLKIISQISFIYKVMNKKIGNKKIIIRTAKDLQRFDEIRMNIFKLKSFKDSKANYNSFKLPVFLSINEYINIQEYRSDMYHQVQLEEITLEQIEKIIKSDKKKSLSTNEQRGIIVITLTFLIGLIVGKLI